MPPDRDAGRASKACTSCRKQKTRCYSSDHGACLRCHTLRLQCSLYTTALQSPYDGRGRQEVAAQRSSEQSPPSDPDDRLLRLERTVNALVHRLETIEDESRTKRSRNDQHQSPVASDDEDHPAPVVLLRHVADEAGISPEEHGLRSAEVDFGAEDVVGNGLLPHATAISLASIFGEHYGRWIALSSHDDPETLLSRLRRSPLLLCACCLIAVRHMSTELAASYAGPLFREAKRLLSEAILTLSQGIDFFRAAVILSFWSTTVGTTPLSLDSWLLSSVTLQHSFASEVFSKPRHLSIAQTATRHALEHQCVWNHLCLSHLHYCVGTRRRTVLDQAAINHCRVILRSDYATNFEVRIVAEINLYWIMYEHCCKSKVDLPRIQQALNDWRQEWSFLFEQPRATFLQMGLHFAHLVAYEQSLKSGTAKVQESLLAEMLRLSKAIVEIAMESTDERTRHLSDHIYHLIAFAAVTLCRLLHKYSQQLATSSDLPGLDDLVMRLVTWLHSVGPTCHVAHTFGDVVAAFHKKLRPHADLASPTSSYQGAEPVFDADFASLFPDLQPYGSLDWPTPSMLLDWQNADTIDMYGRVDNNAT